jgi:hypothetical protein
LSFALAFAFTFARVGPPFVLADGAIQVGGLLSYPTLFLGQAIGVVAPFCPRLDASLFAQNPFQILDVTANPSLLALQSLWSVFTEQQFQQRMEVSVHVFLIVDRPTESSFAQQFHDGLQLQSDMFFLGLGHGPFEQGRPSGVGRRIQFRHAQHQGFESRELVRHLSLAQRELVGRRLSITTVLVLAQCRNRQRQAARAYQPGKAGSYDGHHVLLLVRHSRLIQKIQCLLFLGLID